MKTLMAAGRLTRKSEQSGRADHITVIVRLEGEDARRFESYRGEKCPRDFARELMFERLDQVDERYREPEDELNAAAVEK